MLITHANYMQLSPGLKCHDTKIVDFKYCFDTHTLTVSFTESAFSHIKQIVFEDVLCYRVTGFDPWGHDPFIFDWHFIDDGEADKIFHDVLNQAAEETEYDVHDLVFSEFLFASGDTIQIACKQVQVTE